MDSAPTGSVAVQEVVQRLLVLLLGVEGAETDGAGERAARVNARGAALLLGVALLHQELNVGVAAGHGVVCVGLAQYRLRGWGLRSPLVPLLRLPQWR